MSLGAALSLIGRIAQTALDLEGPVGQIARRVRKLVRGETKTDDTMPSPLTYKDVTHIQDQIRRATEHRADSTPPTARSRYE